MDAAFRPVIALARRTVRQRRQRRGPLRPTWSERYEIFAEVLRFYGKRAHWLPVQAQRSLAHAFLRPSSVTRRTRFEPVVARGVSAEWFHAAGADPERVLLYLHGGGYAIGSIDSHRAAVCRLCESAGVTGLVPDYRLAPEHRFPAQLEDAVGSYRWLLEQGIAPANIVVAGESAGGGLTMSTLYWLRDHGIALPAAAVLISPWLDLFGGGESFADNQRYDYIFAASLRRYRGWFAPEAMWRHPLASPLFGDPHGLPPVLLHAGGAETIRDDASRMAERLEQAGVQTELHIAEDMIHAWHLFADQIDEGAEAIAEVGAWIQARLR
jgi:epsilon-lactone hydrolase